MNKHMNDCSLHDSRDEHEIKKTPKCSNTALESKVTVLLLLALQAVREHKAILPLTSHRNTVNTIKH